MANPTMYQIFQRLMRVYGPQRWWPGETAFEVMVGAVLTQNTSWVNVERAIGNLKKHNALSARRIVAIPRQRLARLLIPVGYFNVKAARLKNFCQWFASQGGLRKLQQVPTDALRNMLLSVNGIGPETADDMLLYAFNRPVFVIDAYTRRLFLRVGIIEGNESYEKLRTLFESKLSRVKEKLTLFNEYHALIVHHAKHVCRSKPLCNECCLRQRCISAVKQG
jgi:endonuclease-3 related protein